MASYIGSSTVTSGVALSGAAAPDVMAAGMLAGISRRDTVLIVMLSPSGTRGHGCRFGGNCRLDVRLSQVEVKQLKAAYIFGLAESGDRLR
jgi:hypothetical protein